MSRVRKIIMSILCAAFATLLAAACVMFGVNARKADAAEIAAEDFKISKIGIRLADDGKQGVRFTVRIKKELLNNANAKVTVYVLPQMFHTGAHLADGSATAISQDLTGYWTDETAENGSATGYAVSAAYIYEIPASNYGVKLLAEAALTYTENDEAVTKWSAVTDGYSLTDVAKLAPADKAEAVQSYIIDKAKITYKNADGTTIGSETLDYGATLNYPAAAGQEGISLNWFTNKRSSWNPAWTAQGDMTLTCLGNVIDEKLLSANETSSESVNESAPVGFKNVWKTNNKLLENKDKNGAVIDCYLRGENYSNADIRNYNEIYYAVKTDFKCAVPTGKVATNGWIYFTFTQNADNTWKATVTYTTPENITKTETSTKNYNFSESLPSRPAGSLAALMYDPWYVPYVANKNSYVYFTELRGVRKPIEITGEKIIDCVYDNIDTSCPNKTVEFGTSVETAPEGFTGVKEFTCSETSLMAKMSHVDIQSYAEVHFAIKTNGYMQIDTSAISKDALKKKYNDWLYFTLVNESTETKVQWRVIVVYQGCQIVNFLNNRNITQKGVCGVLWHGGTVGTMPYNDTKDFKIYSTELRGTLKPTQTTLARAGATDYKIVVPDKSANEDNYGAATRAASELKTFFKEATGADLGNYVQDTGTLQSDMKFISIGFTNSLNSNVEGVDYDALGISGYSIKTINGNVFISGQSAGLMNGVYELLRTYFNYEYYTDGFYKIDDLSGEEVFVQPINEEFVPSFEYRLPAYGFENSATGGFASDPMVSWRMQYNMLSVKGVGGVQWHNFFAAIPVSEYKNAHPNWFSPDGTQLCLTRDKNALAAEMAKKVQEILEKEPSANFVMIGQQDNDDWCTCSSCKKVIAQYGGYNSATYILFMNAVSDCLQPYLEQSGRASVKLGMFAYHKTQNAPVSVTNGKTVLLDGMKLNANVCVVYAPIEANYYVSFNDEKNASVKKNIEGWSLAADNVLYWTYMENFGYYQLIFDNFGSLQENLQLLHDHNGLWLYNLAQYNNGNSTGFSRFKAYLNAKLMWNVNADVAALTDDFFNNYYGVAATNMRKIYNEYRAMTKYIYEHDNNSTIGYLSLNGHVPSAKDFWFSSLKGWLKNVDDALTEADKLKGVNDAECERVKKAVKLESLSIRYALITYFSGNFTAAELSEMKIAWKNDATELNITMCGERKSIETLYSEWKI